VNLLFFPLLKSFFLSSIWILPTQSGRILLVSVLAFQTPIWQKGFLCAQPWNCQAFTKFQCWPFLPWSGNPPGFLSYPPSFFFLTEHVPVTHPIEVTPLHEFYLGKLPICLVYLTSSETLSSPIYPTFAFLQYLVSATEYPTGEFSRDIHATFLFAPEH